MSPNFAKCPLRKQNLLQWRTTVLKGKLNEERDLRGYLPLATHPYPCPPCTPLSALRAWPIWTVSAGSSVFSLLVGYGQRDAFSGYWRTRRKWDGGLILFILGHQGLTAYLYPLSVCLSNSSLRTATPSTWGGNDLSPLLALESSTVPCWLP